MLKNKKTIVFFWVFYITVFGGFAQQSNNLGRNSIPFSVYLSDHDSISFQTVIQNKKLFKDPKTFKKKTNPSQTYWIQLDFKNIADLLIIDTTYNLKFNDFEYATFFYQNNEAIAQRYIGRFDGIKNSELMIYSHGTYFNKHNLIDNRYLYLKVKRVKSFETILQWKFNYYSQNDENIRNNGLTWSNIKKLVPSFMFAGICIIMCLITLSFYVYFRQKEYLFYALYVFSFFLYLSGNNLKIYDFLFNKNLFYGFWFYQNLQMVINIWYLSFISHYLKTAIDYPKLHLTIKILVSILIILVILDTTFIFLNIFTGHVYIMSFHRFIMVLFGICGMIYLLKNQKDKLALFIVIGSFCYMIGALAHIFYNNYYIMLTGVSLEIIVFAFGLTYKMQQTQREKLRFQEDSYINKTKALKAQINPHFIFNSLSSIQHLIATNHKESALKYLTKFSRLMRNIMENSIEATSLLSDEIKILKDYLELESLRFDNAFNYSIQIDEAIDSDAVEVPMLIIQPFVENAILHGLLNKKQGAKTLIITFRMFENYITCEIDDNGVGRNAAANDVNRIKKQVKSRGMEVTENRLQLLNTNNPQEKNIEIIDKYDEQGQSLGTKVIIKIPIN
jgi:sensor histidine kinase YesM